MKVQNFSPIFQKPLKKLPSELIIPLQFEKKTFLTKRKYTEYVYKMIDTSSMQEVAEMVARPVKYFSPFQPYYPIRTPYKSFFIEYLGTDFSGFGYGTKFINFAQKESERLGCEGRVNLVASRIYDPKRPPHIFYKKCGFTSNNTFMNYVLDDCVNNEAKNEDFLYDNLRMYLPISNNDKQPKKLKILKYLSDLKIKVYKVLVNLTKKNPD